MRDPRKDDQRKVFEAAVAFFCFVGCGTVAVVMVLSHLLRCGGH